MVFPLNRSGKDYILFSYEFQWPVITVLKQLLHKVVDVDIDVELFCTQARCPMQAAVARVHTH